MTDATSRSAVLRRAQRARDRLAALAHEPVPARFVLIWNNTKDVLNRLRGLYAMRDVATSTCWFSPSWSDAGLWLVQCRDGHESVLQSLTPQAQTLGRIIRDSGVMTPLSLGPVAFMEDDPACWWAYVIARAEAGDLGVPDRNTKWWYFDDARRSAESSLDLPASDGPQTIKMPTDGQLFELPDAIDSATLAASLLCDDLDRTPAGEAHHQSTTARAQPQASAQGRTRPKSGHELWRTVQDRMLALLDRGELPRTQRSAHKLVKADLEHSNRTARRAIEDSQRLKDHFGVTPGADATSEGGTPILDETMSRLDRDTVSWLSQQPSWNQQKTEQALADMPPQDRLAMLNELARNPDALGDGLSYDDDLHGAPDR